MKFSKNSILPTLAVLLLIILLIFKTGLFKFGSLPIRNFDTTIQIMPKSDLDSLSNLVQFQQDKLDSINRIRNFRISGFYNFYWFSTTFIGIYQVYEKDSYTPSQTNYLSFPSVKLKLEPSLNSINYLQYYYKNGQGYLSKAKFLKLSNGIKKMIRVDKKANFRYSVYTDSVLIPINSTSWGNTLKIFLFFFYIFYGATFLFIILNFVAFLFDISRNMAFDKVNILRLKHMSIYGFLIALIPLLINYAAYLFFTTNYYSEDVEMGYDFWKYDFYVLIFSIIIYLSYKAFNSGMKIKQENDLTI